MQNRDHKAVREKRYSSSKMCLGKQEIEQYAVSGFPEQKLEILREKLIYSKKSKCDVIINIGSDFHTQPSGAVFPITDEHGSGLDFRLYFLYPALRVLEDMRRELDYPLRLIIIIDDGVQSYSSAWIKSAFSEPILQQKFRQDFMEEVIEFQYTNPDFKFYADAMRHAITDPVEVKL